MKFLIGGDGWAWLERATYRGGIGLFYNDTLNGILAYAIIAIICILAVIGLITVLGWIFGGIRSGGRGKKMSSHEKWIKTGKF